LLDWKEFCVICRETGVLSSNYENLAAYLHDIGDIIYIPHHFVVTDPKLIIEIILEMTVENLDVSKISEDLQVDFSQDLESKIFSLKVLQEVWKKYLTPSQTQTILSVFESLAVVVRYAPERYIFPWLCNRIDESPVLQEMNFGIRCAVSPGLGVQSLIFVRIVQALKKSGSKHYRLYQNGVKFFTNEMSKVHFWYGARSVWLPKLLDKTDIVWFELNINGKEQKILTKVREIVEEVLKQPCKVWEIAVCPKCKFECARKLNHFDEKKMGCCAVDWSTVSHKLGVQHEDLINMIEKMKSRDHQVYEEKDKYKSLEERIQDKMEDALEFCSLLTQMSDSKEIVTIRKRAKEAFETLIRGDKM
jgi:hypothetical protein